MDASPTAGSACALGGVKLRLMQKAFWKTTIPSLLYLAMALACLIRWGASDPWSRVDVFSGGYLLLRLVGSVHSIFFNRRVFSSEETRREWWATASDPGWIKWVVLLMAADLIVFLDYGHWRLTPALERPWLQGLGLGLYVLAAVWQMWTDAYLASYFAREPASAPIEKGPFRHVRHPRYAGAIAGKLAFALVFASGFGWLLALAWALLLTRKVEIEEAHLRKRFGAEYEAYTQKTSRLLPGIY